MGLFKKCCNKADANIVDGKFILTCPNALSPVVWQMDLSDTKASAMEVQPDGESHKLILKTPNGKFTDIAIFQTKEAAIQALMAASSALKNAHGQMHYTSDTTLHAPTRAHPKQKGGWLKKIFTILGILLVGYILLIVIAGFFSRGSSVQEQPQPSGGVPMSADDFLKGR